ATMVAATAAAPAPVQARPGPEAGPRAGAAVPVASGAADPPPRAARTGRVGPAALRRSRPARAWAAAAAEPLAPPSFSTVLGSTVCAQDWSRRATFSGWRAAALPGRGRRGFVAV